MRSDGLGYAAYCTFGHPRPYINLGSVAWYARDVRRYMGEAFARPNETWQKGWKRAFKEGYRIIKVRVEAAESLLRFGA